MLASTLMLIALLCAGVLIKVPYAEMSPGPTVNTLADHGGEPVIQINGHKTYDTSGHLNMTTVRVTSADYNMNLVSAVYGWLAHDSIVEINLARPPVNALDLELLQSLRLALEESVAAGARGILLSGGQGMFSAGVDVCVFNKGKLMVL